MKIGPRLFSLALAEARRSILMRIRYPVATLGGMLMIGATYFVVSTIRSMLGVGGATSQGDGSAKWTIVAATCLWMLSVAGIARLSRCLGEDYKSGLIEIFLLSRIPIVVSLSTLYAVSAIYPLVLMSGILATVAASGAPGAPTLWAILGGVLLFEISLMGISFAVAGLSLAFKKLGSAISALYILVFLAEVYIATRTGNPHFALVPFLGPASVVIRGGGSWSAMDWAGMALVSGGVLLLGIAAFNSLKGYSLKAGTIYLE